VWQPAEPGGQQACPGVSDQQPPLCPPARWGLRCRKDLKPGAFVCAYVGELITDEEAVRAADSDPIGFWTASEPCQQIACPDWPDEAGVWMHDAGAAVCSSSIVSFDPTEC
jgi:SET domain